jgi:hypothetical protein
MDSNECQNCGKKLPERTEKRGRKRIYCSGSCRAQVATRRKEAQIRLAAFDMKEALESQDMRSRSLIDWDLEESSWEVAEYLDAMAALAFRARENKSDFEYLANSAHTFVLAAEMAGLWSKKDYQMPKLLRHRMNHY